MTKIEEDLVELTRQLILMRTTEFEPDERRRCIDFIRSHIDVLENLELREIERNGCVSLIAHPAAFPEPEILMVGHIDVVAHSDPSVYRGEIRDGRIVGPGAGDMKGAVAIILEIFRNTLRRHPEASIGIVITSDEEIGGENGIGHLFGEAGIRCGIALVPDGGSLNRITIHEKGILHLGLHCKGLSGHGSRPWLGDSAAELLIERLGVLRDRFNREFPATDDHWHPTCAITTLNTPNRTINRIPATAHANLDVRFPHPHTTTEMLAFVRDVLGPRIEVEVVIPAEPADFSPDPRFLEITAEVTNEPVVLERSDGGSDARFIAAQGIPAIISRPISGNYHAVDEWIDIESMGTFYRIYERYVSEKLLRGTRS
jgi:succinyl-diaminopimelate desuccinylase